MTNILYDAIKIEKNLIGNQSGTLWNVSPTSRKCEKEYCVFSEGDFRKAEQKSIQSKLV